ncbi:MAG: acetyl-CoA carboxylase biotin carboxyl carrier protein [Candidatus Omnitrophota bacterium]|nr:acetyl-CoA carboxylase biotin carboxyl carrier protein [Candidatus Omnitrophota bacterium]MDZ4241749.1 acetyl-CoA carboxylase biotin carboxyl carrier protein [Candidatus Omnitrophota bacterium]
MNLKEIKDIINLMNEHDLAEIEVEREGTKIKIRKSSALSGAPGRSPAEFVVEGPAAPAAQSAAAPAAAALVRGNAKDIKSPMVGTFYRAPSPEAPPFVDVGQIVEVGQVVCIVEAMKLMNEIKSEIRGRVVEVAMENAEPVEFGQTLFVVEPA